MWVSSDFQFPVKTKISTYLVEFEMKFVSQVSCEKIQLNLNMLLLKKEDVLE